MNDETKRSTSWGGVANWYKGMVEAEGSFQQEVILPNLLRLMDLKKGQSVLDIACGNGFFGNAFYELGATVTGTDVSPELIELARKNSPKPITFKVTPAAEQKMITNGSIDKVTIIEAIQNIEQAEQTLVEVARVLKPGGKVYIVMNHPAFRIPQGSQWGWSGREIQFRRVEKYLTPFEVDIKMHPGDNPDDLTKSFHRPMQFYVQALSRAGLAVTNMEEWVSNKHSDSGPRANAENVARQEIPLFLFLEATKV